MEEITLEDMISRYNNPYSPGDIVRLRSGSAHQRVLEVRGGYIHCEYIKIQKQVGFRDAADYELITKHDNTDNNEEEFDMKDKLYKTVTDNRFGTGLAIDSDGKYVLKMQDSGNFESFDESNLKRVMPYTFDVQFLDGRSSNTYAYRGREGQVVVGDILILHSSNSIARVVAVNTESEKATKTFDGVKLLTAELA